VSVRLVRYPTTDGSEAWAKEIGSLVLPASSDEVAMWKEAERLRRLVEEALLHYEIGCGAADGGLPVAWDYVAERMASALREQDERP
jgi:hypothetical protein